MRITVLLCSLLVALGAAAPAGAAQVTKTAGTTTATLRWTPPADDGIAVTGLRLTIVRDGATVFDADPGVARCTGADARCAVQTFGDGPLTVRDVDGDGQPDVVVWLFTGGAHCCSVVRVLGVDAATGAAGGPSHDFLDPGARLRDLDADGTPEFVTADARLAYRFASFASSGFPLRVLALRAGVFQDVTGRFPGRVRADARRYLRLYRAALRRPDTEPEGPLAAWAADRYRLGRRASARAFLRRELRDGHLDHGIARVRGRAFIRQLDRVLGRLGYR